MKHAFERYPDDGGREALNTFMLDRNACFQEMINFFYHSNQYWKARVFAELLWEYEKPDQITITETLKEMDALVK